MLYVPGVGEALSRALAEHFRRLGRSYLDLSVAHDNAAAIGLYEKLGFRRVPVLAIKRKNAINEPLFTPPPETVDDLNPYARIIADEALRRGIWVEVLDAELGRHFTESFFGKMQKQAEAIAISRDGMGARLALAEQAVSKEGLKKRGKVGSNHGCTSLAISRSVAS